MKVPLSKRSVEFSFEEGPEWLISKALVPYEDALAAMQARVNALAQGQAREQVWLLEHPSLYTAGTSAQAEDLVDPGKFPVYPTGRGGRMTYHGPGQRIAYVMTDLRRRGKDVRAHVARLETWVIRVLADFGVRGELREGRVGVWVVLADGREAKIAALGVRVSRWVTWHGLALNVHPELSHFSGIVPCGLAGFGVTSLWALGRRVSLGEVDTAFQRRWGEVFEGKNAQNL